MRRLLAIGLLAILPVWAPATPTPPPAPPQASSGRQLHVGESIASSLTDPETPDRFVVFAAYGDLISVGVFPEAAGAHSPSLEIDGPDGTAVATVAGTTSALVSAFKIPATGAYILYIKADTRDALVPYTVSVGAGWILRDMDAGALTLNTPAHGSLARLADRSVWRLTIPAGTAFLVTAKPSTASTFDPVIEVLTPGGEQLAVAHDLGNTNSAATGVITATAGGTYLVRISAYVNATIGDYDLIARALPPTPTPVVTSQPIDQHLDGHVGAGAQYNDTFWGVPGQTVTITVQSKTPDTFEPLVELYGPSGRRVAASDDSAPGANPTLTALLNDGIGIYFVRVSGYALMAGDFTLAIKSP